MRFTHAWRAEKNHVARLMDESQRAKLSNLPFINGRLKTKIELIEVLQGTAGVRVEVWPADNGYAVLPLRSRVNPEENRHNSVRSWLLARADSPIVLRWTSSRARSMWTGVVQSPSSLDTSNDTLVGRQ